MEKWKKKEKNKIGKNREKSGKYKWKKWKKTGKNVLNEGKK